MGAKGNKKRNNKYLPTTLHLSIFPLPSIQYTVWDREIGALCSTPISMFQTVPSMFFIVRSVPFPIKTFYVSIAFSCHKIIFFSSGFGEINKKQPSSRKKKKTPFFKKKKKKKKKKS